MKKIILILLVAVVAFAVYWFKFREDDRPSGPKQQALTVNKHSTTFNGSIDSLLQSYFVLKDAFADGDSVKAKQQGLVFVAFVSRLNLDELKKDTGGIFESAVAFANDVRANAEGMGQSQTLSEMRQGFKAISDNIYPLLKTIHYEGKKLFWQYCPTALGESGGANWISETENIINPYLGRAHADCGEIQDTIKAQ